MNNKWLVDKLFSEVPEFERELYTNQDFGFISQLYTNKDELCEKLYTVTGDFAMFFLSLARKTERTADDEIFLRKGFKFIGEMLISPTVNTNPELLNVIYLGILTNLSAEPKINDLAQIYLKGESFRLFQLYLDKINNNETW